jgi:hypothetical protein
MALSSAHTRQGILFPSNQGKHREESTLQQQTQILMKVDCPSKEKKEKLFPTSLLHNPDPSSDCQTSNNDHPARHSNGGYCK